MAKAKRPKPVNLICLLLAFLLAVVTYVVYSAVGSFHFINLDDPDYVYRNEFVTTGLNKQNFIWAFTLHGPGQWHPLTWLSHQADCHFFGVDAGKHHMVSAVLHVVNSALLFLVLRQLTGRLGVSYLVASLFALHPLSVESVAWVSERRDVLSTFFWILTISAYCAYARRGGWWRYALVVVLHSCGLMSKPMVVTLPCVLLLLDKWPLSRIGAKTDEGKPRKGWILDKLPLFALSALASWFTIAIQIGEQAVGTFESYPMMSRLMNAAISYVTYLRKMIFPNDLACFYPYSSEIDWVTGNACLILLALISFFTVWQLARRPYLFVCWFFYLGTLVPVVGLMQVGSQSMADRYTYIPLIGVYLLLAQAASDGLVKFFPKRQAASHATLTAVVWGYCLFWTIPQVGYWENDFHLYTHALEVTEDNFPAHNNLAADYHTIGKIEEARHHFESARAIDPRQVQPYMGLGTIAEDEGDVGEAIRMYQEALNRYKSRVAEPIITRKLGFVLAAAPDESMRDADQALKLAQRSVALQRDSASLDTLAVALAATGDYENAVKTAEQAVMFARQRRMQRQAKVIEERLELYRNNKPFRLGGK